jgi:hypothetical protein
VTEGENSFGKYLVLDFVPEYFPRNSIQKLIDKILETACEDKNLLVRLGTYEKFPFGQEKKGLAGMMPADPADPATLAKSRALYLYTEETKAGIGVFKVFPVSIQDELISQLSELFGFVSDQQEGYIFRRANSSEYRVTLTYGSNQYGKTITLKAVYKDQS